MLVGPGHVVAVKRRRRLVGALGLGVVVLIELAGDDRYVGGDRSDLGVPAGDVVAGLAHVVVERSRLLVERVVGRVVGPLGEIVGVVEATDHDGLGGAGGADRVNQGLHADDLVAGRRIAVGIVGLREAGNRRRAATDGVRLGPRCPAAPGDRVRRIPVVSRPRVGGVIRLVEDVEHDRRIGLERGGHRVPEVGGVGIRHRLLFHGDLRTWRGPMQVEDRVEAVCVQGGDVVLDRLAVAGRRERGWRILAAVGLAVDPQPAVLVERYPDGVGVPRRDSGGVGRVLMPVVVAEAVDARVLRARVIDAQEPDRLARAIDEVVALDRDRQRRPPPPGLPPGRTPTRRSHTRCPPRPAVADPSHVEAPVPSVAPNTTWLAIPCPAHGCANRVASEAGCGWRVRATAANCLVARVAVERRRDLSAHDVSRRHAIDVRS